MIGPLKKLNDANVFKGLKDLKEIFPIVFFYIYEDCHDLYFDANYRKLTDSSRLKKVAFAENQLTMVKSADLRVSNDVYYRRVGIFGAEG